jgi:hypothetical protein
MCLNTSEDTGVLKQTERHRCLPSSQQLRFSPSSSSSGNNALYFEPLDVPASLQGRWPTQSKHVSTLRGFGLPWRCRRETHQKNRSRVVTALASVSNLQLNLQPWKTKAACCPGTWHPTIRLHWGTTRKTTLWTIPGVNTHNVDKRLLYPCV